MAKTKAKEINALSPEELQVRLRELKEESLNLRLQKSAGSLENPARIKTVRRETARVLTALNARRNS